jgi:hypothetical protein
MMFIKRVSFLNRTSTLIAGVLTVLLSLSHAKAFYSVLNTGEVLKPGEYQAMASPQVVFNRYSGTNFAGRLDMGLEDGVSARGVLGFGKVDFQIGGLIKWVPFPDTESQPSIGGEAGLIVSRIGGINQYSLRFNPLVSKKFETEIGDVTPYGSLPIGVTIQSGDTTETITPVQLVGGAELHPLDLKNWRFLGELGLNVSQSFSFVSFGIAYRFDESQFGIRN